MRYKESGELHKDFHGATNCTIKYICENFGKDTLHEIFFKTGCDVYKDIREHLAGGDVSELLNFWRYFFDREGADYAIAENEEEITLTVNKCPAVEHLKKLGMEPHAEFCSQTVFVNNGICEETSYEIETQKTGDVSCLQVLRRKTK